MPEQAARVPTLHVHGADIPRLGLGTWRLSGQVCRDAVLAAIASGYRHIDTAAMYGNEAEVGAALASSGLPRDALFLTTKVWRDDLKREALLRSAEASVSRLGGPVDLLLVHWPNSAVPLAETMTALDEARRKGLTRHVGVSNFPAAMLREAAERCESPIFADQCEYHPEIDQSVLIDACRTSGTAFVSYQPLGQGKLLRHPTIEGIAADHGHSASQVLLRWHMQQPGVVAIPRSSTATHIAENMAIFDFTLSDAEMGRIFALASKNGRHVDPDWAPRWDPPSRPGA